MPLPIYQTLGTQVLSTSRPAWGHPATNWLTLHMVTVQKRIRAGRETARTNQTRQVHSWTASTDTNKWSQRNHPTQLQIHTNLKRHNGADPTQMRTISTTWSADASWARGVPMDTMVTTHCRGNRRQVTLNKKRTPQTDWTSTTLPWWPGLQTIPWQMYQTLRPWLNPGTAFMRTSAKDTILPQSKPCTISSALLLLGGPPPREGYRRVPPDSSRYLIEAHKLSFNNIKGKVYYKTRKRTRAFGLFLNNNWQFLFQYRVDMRLPKNLAQKSAAAASSEPGRSREYPTVPSSG